MVSPLPRRDHISDQERDGWQLLLWSYRHELDVNDTHAAQGDNVATDDKAWWSPSGSDPASPPTP